MKNVERKLGAKYKSSYGEDIVLLVIFMFHLNCKNMSNEMIHFIIYI